MTTKVYYIDSDQLSVINRVKSRLYNEMQKLSADDRRDLANTLDAVVHSIENCGEAGEVLPQSNKEFPASEIERSMLLKYRNLLSSIFCAQSKLIETHNEIAELIDDCDSELSK